MIGLIAGQLPSVMRIFEEGKQQTFFIKEQIPFVEAQVRVNIPTPESILNLLPLVTTPNQMSIIVANFVKLKETCKKAEKIVQDLINQIDKILDKLSDIERIFTTLSGFISFISDFIPLLKTLIGIGQIALAAQVFPIASGTVTIRVGDAIKLAKAKIREFDALVKVVDPITTFIRQEIDSLQEVLFPVRRKLVELLTQIRARCFYLDSVLLDKLKELELAMAQNPPIGGGIDGPQGTGTSQTTEQIVNILADQVPPELILDNLENSNKERFVEYLVENGLTGYQIVKK
jgi:hypothetical protein